MVMNSFSQQQTSAVEDRGNLQLCSNTIRYRHEWQWM